MTDDVVTEREVAAARAAGVAIACPVPLASRPCQDRCGLPGQCTCLRVARAVLVVADDWVRT